MTTITLDVPDDLASRLGMLREHLPELLAKVLDARSQPKPTIGAGTTYPVYQEMLDFLATRPTPEQLIAFKISPLAQARLEELLDKNQDEGVTEAENAELDVYELVHHSMIRLKAQARQAQP